MTTAGFKSCFRLGSLRPYSTGAAWPGVTDAIEHARERANAAIEAGGDGEAVQVEHIAEHIG